MRIGRVGRPHGRDGAFAVAEPTARPGLLDAGRRVTVAGFVREIAWRGGTADRPLVRLAGVEGRDGAARLGGEELTVPREALGPLGAREHLIDDLVGCVVTDGKRRVGIVQAVVVLPSVECLEVDRSPEGAGSPAGTRGPKAAGIPEEAGRLLIPLVRDAVRSIDTGARRIDVDLAFVGAGD